MRQKAAILLSFFLLSFNSLQAAKISEKLYENILESPGKIYPVVLLMSERPDLREISNRVEGLPRNEKSAVVCDYLADLAEVSQSDLKNYLSLNSQSVEAFRSLNICNGIILKATGDLLLELLERDDVYKLIDDSPRSCPVETSTVSDELDELDYIAAQIPHIGANIVWDDGYTGDGILVAIVDTGVNYSHLDLVDHLWDGGEEYPNHGYDFHNEDVEPEDNNGHGTKVAGVVAGDGTAGDTTGIAPDAIIMALKVRETMSIGVVSSTWTAQQFCLQQGVDIVSMSLGWGNPADGDREVWRNNYSLLLEAGIVSFKSAGNNGSSRQPPNSISVPGCVPSPWRHPDEVEAGGRSGLITVGAVDYDDEITSFSSRGPVTWQEISPWFDYLFDETEHVGLIKPDIVTLGRSGRSLANTNNTGYPPFSMTSMAQPVAAGTAALLLQKNPDLSPVELDSILQTTALELGAPGKDNEYGAGRVDAVAASDAIEVPMGSVSGSVANMTSGEVIEGMIVYSINRPRRHNVLGDDGSYNFDHQTETTRIAVAFPPMPRRPLYVSDEIEIFEDEEIELDIEFRHGIIEYDVNNLFFPFEDYSDTVSTELEITNSGDADLEFRFHIDCDDDPLLEEDMFLLPEDVNVLSAGSAMPVEIILEGDSSLVGELNANLIVYHNAGLETDTIPMMVSFNSVEEKVSETPSDFRITKVYPNPFNSSAFIHYNIPAKTEIRVEMFDILGRKVQTLKSGKSQAGDHKIRIDGSELANGLYFVRFNSLSSSQILKVILLK